MVYGLDFTPGYLAKSAQDPRVIAQARPNLSADTIRVQSNGLALTPGALGQVAELPPETKFIVSRTVIPEVLGCVFHRSQR